MKDHIADLMLKLECAVSKYASSEAGKTVYSIDREYFNHEDLDELVVDEVCAKGYGADDGFTVYSGILEPCRASQFMHVEQVDCEAARDRASFEVGDLADDWLSAISDQDSEAMEKAQSLALDAWAITTDHHPSFYQVTDVREIRVLLTRVPEVGYEIEYSIESDELMEASHA